MQVSVEETSELSRKMTVRIPEELIQEKVNARIQSLSREVKLDGFRPGKVPQKVVIKMFGSRVREEVTGELIQSSYYDALEERNLKPVGPPSIVPANDQSGSENGFEYIADFEVYPEVSLEEIEQIEIKKPVVEIDESDIDNMIAKLREQKKEWRGVQRAAQENDRVTISFSGTCDGENFTHGKVDDYQVEIGSGQMIPGFEENLIGLESGTSKTFEITFPEEYGNKELAGKAAKFEVEVTQVEESVLPEVDAEFIKAYGIEDGDLDAFRKDIRANMQHELEQALRGRLKNAVMDELNARIKVTLPKAMVDHEIDILKKPYEENAEKQKQDIQQLDIPLNALEEQAKRRVALGLILAEIIQKNDIRVKGEKVRSTVEDMAKSFDYPDEVINWYYSDEKRLAEVEQMILEDQAVDWVLDKVHVTDEKARFDEIMNSN